MKKLLLLLFSLMLSFNSYGEWTLIHTDDDFETVYIDLNTIKKHNEFIYWWAMFEDEGMSVKTYLQGDCGITRLKNLTMLSYNQPMGKGEADTRTFDNPEWSYQPPDSVAGFLLDTSCRLVEASAKEQQEIIEEIQSKEELQRLLRIEEDKAKANEDLAKELELRLLELEKLIQEKNQQLKELIELRTEYEKDELLLSLVELKKLVEEEEQQVKIAQELTQIELELKNQLEAEIASQQQAYEREQYNRLLTQEIQESKSSELMQQIEDQKRLLDQKIQKHKKRIDDCHALKATLERKIK